MIFLAYMNRIRVQFTEKKIFLQVFEEIFDDKMLVGVLNYLNISVER